MISSSVVSEELSPRAYTHLPINQHFIGLGYAYVDGDVYTSADVPVEDLNLKIQGPILAYVHTFDLFGNSAIASGAIGQTCVDGSAIYQGEYITRDFCGLTDSKFTLNYNFYGAPALGLKEYVKRKKGLVAGFSLQIGAPTGDYDDQYLINIGNNRWVIKPEVGMSYPLSEQWEVNLSFGVKFFTDNDELLKTQTFEQDPIFNTQFHLVYDINPRQWIAFNSNYFAGGDTYVDGEKRNAKKGNYRAGITYSMSIDSHNSVKLFANTGVTTRLGNDSDAFGVSWTHRW